MRIKSTRAEIAEGFALPHPDPVSRPHEMHVRRHAEGKAQLPFPPMMSNAGGNDIAPLAKVDHVPRPARPAQVDDAYEGSNR